MKPANQYRRLSRIIGHQAACECQDCGWVHFTHRSGNALSEAARHHHVATGHRVELRRTTTTVYEAPAAA